MNSKIYQYGVIHLFPVVCSYHKTNKRNQKGPGKLWEESDVYYPDYDWGYRKCLPMARLIVTYIVSMGNADQLDLKKAIKNIEL